MNFFYVFLGGGLGALSRYGIARLVPVTTHGFPWATFITNIISCIFLGYLLGLTLNKGLDNRLQLLLMTGFCGGFSTFSSYTAETLKLLEQQQYSLVLIYVFASILLCLICMWIGIKIST
ncbi:MAG: fluoride efflux transporter CrcB [Saprospiraceae bacterium]|nr:fluoride efflux transporter CrcB [Bacteroidia bacterium]NNF22737.1 fluoride efflux transporter CrcB [Saprospiraceae bacterium]